MSKFAIIGIGGKQFLVKEGDKVVCEKVAEKEGETIKLNHIFLVGDRDDAKIGIPLVENASVEAKVLKIQKGKKVRVFKQKARKRYHKEHGHRQFEMEIEIIKISS